MGWGGAFPSRSVEPVINLATGRGQPTLAPSSPIVLVRNRGRALRSGAVSGRRDPLEQGCGRQRRWHTPASRAMSLAARTRRPMWSWTRNASRRFIMNRRWPDGYLEPMHCQTVPPTPSSLGLPRRSAPSTQDRRCVGVVADVHPVIGRGCRGRPAARKCLGWLPYSLFAVRSDT